MDGELEIPASPGAYDLRFPPQDDSGLPAYLAAVVGAASTAPLRFILKPITVIHFEGVVRVEQHPCGRTSLTFTPTASEPPPTPLPPT
ncbi:hypothetical protein [Micromonospora sp. CA-244673]|uniref:hypothetical protein n=1 Tax=Micromonospora sp. CA-244673 TaxID=3239958 RepID=UPI003D8E0155